MRISDWSSDVCSSDLGGLALLGHAQHLHARDAGADFGSADQVAHVDAADVVAFLQVGRVLRVGLAVGDRVLADARGEALQHGEVLHLLHCEDVGRVQVVADRHRSEEHTSELQSLMRISYAVFCLKKKQKTNKTYQS